MFASAPAPLSSRVWEEVARLGLSAPAYRYDVLPECFSTTNQSTGEPAGNVWDSNWEAVREAVRVSAATRDSRLGWGTCGQGMLAIRGWNHPHTTMLDKPIIENGGEGRDGGGWYADRCGDGEWSREWGQLGSLGTS